ncbi:MAG: methyltransferase type 11 [Gammaproteobacteria bacterium]|nr:methyltransferase type 11 [Gammaproteobacteria bacterium]
MIEDLKERVAREKVQHDEDGVLERSFELKGRFPHVMNSPTMRRCDADENAVYENLHGKRVLDLGCGFGQKSIFMAGLGATVSGIDIAENYICQARESAADAGVSDKCTFAEMDAHSLAFEDDTFDLVVGRAIIHHLDLPVSLLEIKRVLKPGGRAMFVEPLGENPMLKLFRKLTPAARTIDEKPLYKRDLNWIAKHFNVASRYYGLLSAPAAMVTSVLLRPYPNNPVLRVTDWAERILQGVRWLQPLHQYVLLDLKKPSDH